MLPLRQKYYNKIIIYANYVLKIGQIITRINHFVLELLSQNEVELASALLGRSHCIVESVTPVDT